MEIPYSAPLRERASERQRGVAVNDAASASEGSSPSAPTIEEEKRLLARFHELL